MSLSRQIVLKPTDEQKKALSELQHEADDKLDQILTADQKDHLRQIKNDFGRGGASRAGADRPGGPPGLGRGAPGGDTAGRTLKNPVFRAHRYGADYAGLAGKDLKPGKTIEELEAKQREKE
jgi:hypothetical protein